MSQTRSRASPRAIASARDSISAKASAYCVSPGETIHSTGGASSGASNDAREARRELTTRLCIRADSSTRARTKLQWPVQLSRTDFLKQVCRGSRGRVVHGRRSLATRCVCYVFCAGKLIYVWRRGKGASSFLLLFRVLAGLRINNKINQ